MQQSPVDRDFEGLVAVVGICRFAVPLMLHPAGVLRRRFLVLLVLKGFGA